MDTLYNNSLVVSFNSQAIGGGGGGGGLTMAKLHPLPCPHVFNNAQPGFGEYMPNFGLFNPSISFDHA